MTVGVKARLTPKLLNSTVIVGNPLVAAEEPEIGTGNSPPARKLAVWPDIAVRFGSARLVMNPSCSSAEIIALVDPKHPMPVVTQFALLSVADAPAISVFVGSPMSVTGLLVM